jgi:hypothetical protein
MFNVQPTKFTSCQTGGKRNTPFIKYCCRGTYSTHMLLTWPQWFSWHKSQVIQPLVENKCVAISQHSLTCAPAPHTKFLLICCPWPNERCTNEDILCLGVYKLLKIPLQQQNNTTYRTSNFLARESTWMNLFKSLAPFDIYRKCMFSVS